MAAVPLVLVCLDVRANRDVPDLNAAWAATILNAPVIDLNTLPERADRVLAVAADTLGLVVRSSTAPAARELAARYRQRWPRSRVVSVSGPLRVQCCYPYLEEGESISAHAPFGDELPFPEYARFDSFAHYQRGWASGAWAYPLMTSHGCPFGCRFCASRRTPWRTRSVANCGLELLNARMLWGISSFQVLDDCFNVDRERVIEFCKRVRPLQLNWTCANGVRADRLDEATAAAMAEAGCTSMTLGIESTDPDVLQATGKGETLDDFERAVAIGKRHFAAVNGFFIIGLPGSTYAKDLASLEWARNRGVRAHFSFHVPQDRVGVPREGSVFYGGVARPCSDAYSPAEQERLYRLTASGRPATAAEPRLRRVVALLRSALRPKARTTCDVLHVASHLPGYHRAWGGAERVTARIVAAQRDAGLDARVVTSPPQTSHRDALPVGVLPSLGDWLGRPLALPFDPVSSLVLLGRLLRDRPRVVHLHNPQHFSFSPVIAAALLRIPVVHSVYDYWSVCPKQTLVDQHGLQCARFHGIACGRCLAGGQRSWAALARGVGRRLIIEHLRTLVARTVVLSAASRDLMAAAGVPRARLRVVHQPYPSRAAPDRTGPGDGRTLLYAGWLEPHKGLHLLVEALAAVRQRHPEAKLAIFGTEGDATYIARLRERLTELRLEGAVEWCGRVSGAEMVAAMADAAAVVVPEQWANMSPVIVLEAMAIGRPIVATNVGGIPEFVTNGVTGLLAAPGSAASLAQAITAILANPTAAADMGRRARERALHEFDEQHAISAMLAVYAELGVRGAEVHHG